jgi:hypothetical protein
MAAQLEACLALVFIFLSTFLPIFRSLRSSSSSSFSTVDDIAENRYHKLVSQSTTLRLAYNLLGTVAAFVAWHSAFGKTTFDPGSLTLALYVSLQFLCLHRVSLAYQPEELMKVYRRFYTTSQIAFRGSRIMDMLRSSDLDEFVGNAGMALDQHSTMNILSCFVMGWLLGMMQPPRPKGGRLAWVSALMFGPLFPPLLGFFVTINAHWLSAVFLYVFCPTAMGFLVELLQRYFVIELLRLRVQDELALQLPTAGQIDTKTGLHATSGDGGTTRSSSAAELSISDFSPVGILGFGGSAQVRLMRNMRDGGKLHAVKSIIKMRHGRALDTRAVGQIQEEIAVLREAHCHPYIISLVSHFEDTTAVHVVLEYAESGCLGTWLENKSFAEPMARGVTAEVVLAIEHLHSHRILYRDLKPENVLVKSTGHIMLADFGISKRLLKAGELPEPVAQVEAKTMVGTPGYMAPEVLEGWPAEGTCGRPRKVHYSYPVDWWALGSLVHKMLTTCIPFDVRTILDFLALKEREQQLIDSHVSESLSLDAHDFVSALLRFQVARRLGTAFGSIEVKTHPFLAAVEWDAVQKGIAEPPLPPLDSMTAHT